MVQFKNFSKKYIWNSKDKLCLTTLLKAVNERFEKYVNDQMSADTTLHDRTLSDMSNILDLIVDCCQENNWFGVDEK